MSLLITLVIAGIAAWLWRRVGALERRVEQLELRGIALPAPDPAEHLGPAQEAQIEPIPVADAAPAANEAPSVPEEQRAPWRLDVEDLFGRLLPIWTGGVALAAAGFFLVRWSIDAGLLTPPVRVALAGLFGIALLAAAEIAYRWRERVADPRVAQALAGAGLATLYAAFYLAGAGYGLVGSGVAFIGLASVTAAAIGLSSRFGLPSAVLGLVGGFAAPALVGGEDANLPLLTVYLALVTGGLALSGRRQERDWLGVAALAAGLGWGALLLARSPERTADVAFLGAFLVLLGTAVPALFAARGTVQRVIRIGAAGIAAVQLAVLVEGGGFGVLEWGLYLALGAALAWYGWREPAMREGAALAAAVGIALLALWPDASHIGFAAVALALTALFAGVPLAEIARKEGDILALGQVTGVSLGLAGALYVQFAEFMPTRADLATGAALAALAGLPALAAHLHRRRSPGSPSIWREAAWGAAALLGYAALAQVMPADGLAWSAALAAGLIAWGAPHLRGALWTLAAIAATWAIGPLAQWSVANGAGLYGAVVAVSDLPSVRAVALWLVPVLAAALAWRLRASPPGDMRRVLDIVAIAMAVVTAHVAFRHALAGVVGDDFVRFGVIQRATWEALLLGAALICWQRRWTGGALVFAALSAAHFAWFSAGLHNPLWAEQAIGSLPLANALVLAYAVGIGGLALLRRLIVRPLDRAVLDGAIMLAITLFALSQLRQAFAGSLLTSSPVGPTEDLLRSFLGIVLALGFLLWGARTRARSWRVGSLALMVVAVLKVFLVDAAGLGGLARIASFMALGFSLIGIGWFYSRQLRALPRAENEATVT